MPLYQHVPHEHKVRNVNKAHEAELAAAGFNTRLAVGLTKSVGTMWTAYIFTTLSVIGLLGLLGLLNPFVFLLTTWISQQFLQLVLLPVIMVGQNVLGRKAELLAEEQFTTTQETYHDIQQIMEHLNAQDEKILEIAEKVAAVEQIAATDIGKQTEMLTDILEMVKSYAQPVVLLPTAPLPLPPAATRLPPSISKQPHDRGKKA
jgi:uncharacterized membrane protein